MKEPTLISGGEAILRALKANAIDYLFINPGSDFAPLIEAFAALGSDEIPEAIAVAHEHAAVTMAHGYYLATGQMQAAAVHVNVGLANAVMALLNAHSDDVPIFMMSGRNPLTEGDRMGSRRSPIQYGQEMFDQNALVREAVKWDYELRYAENAADLVSRGCAIAKSQPEGAVYLALPREPLCETTAHVPTPLQATPSPPYPDPDAIKRAAAALAEAENPLIICSRGDTAGQVGQILMQMAADNALSISEVYVTRNVVASNCPNSIGGNVAAHLPTADVVLAVDTPVAWIETKTSLAPDAQLIHLGPDPLFNRIPVRGYRNTHAIACNTVAGLKALHAALPNVGNKDRQATIEQGHAKFRANIRGKAERGRSGLPSKAWVASCVSEVIGDGAIFGERAGPCSTFTVVSPNQWFGNTQAGGLGWALPAALGFQLANRDRLVACVIGDGSYMFANPIVCHQVAEAQKLPLLTVILNNASWDAVRTSTLDVYPDGAAAQANVMPTVPFLPAPDYGKIAAASGCYAETIERGEDLRAALQRAVRVIREDRRQVLLDVKVGLDSGEK